MILFSVIVLFVLNGKLFVFIIWLFSVVKQSLSIVFNMASTHTATNPYPNQNSVEQKNNGKGAGRWTHKKKNVSEDVAKLSSAIQHLSTRDGDDEIGKVVEEVDTEWKWPIRHKVWDLMEKEDYADEPRPVRFIFLPEGAYFFHPFLFCFCFQGAPSHSEFSLVRWQQPS